jgi:hypothetical protein
MHLYTKLSQHVFVRACACVRASKSTLKRMHHRVCVHIICIHSSQVSHVHTGRPYYYNTVTKQSTWEKPLVTALPPPAPPHVQVLALVHISAWLPCVCICDRALTLSICLRVCSCLSCVCNGTITKRDIHASTSLSVCLYVCIYMRMYVCTHKCMHVCMYAHMYVCMYACMKIRNTGTLAPGVALLVSAYKGKHAYLYKGKHAYLCKSECHIYQVSESLCIHKNTFRKLPTHLHIHKYRYNKTCICMTKNVDEFTHTYMHIYIHAYTHFLPLHR